MNFAFGRLKLALVAGDLGVAVAAALLAAVIRFGVGPTTFPYPLAALAAAAALWPLVLQLEGSYAPMRLRSASAELRDILKAGLAFAGLVLVAVALSHAYELSRLFLLLFFALLVALTVASRIATRGLLARLRRSGRNVRRLLIVGAGPEGQAILRHVTSRPELGVRVVGFVDDRSPQRVGVDPRRIVGSLASLPDLLRQQVVDEVVVTLPLTGFERVRPVLAAASEEGKNVYLSVRGVEGEAGALARSRLTEVDGMPFLGLIYAPDHLLALLAKRLLDIAGAAVTLGLLSPLLFAIAVLVRLQSPGPVIFRQQRVGLNGRLFTLYKFRTMVADAEARLGEVMARNELAGPVFKLRDDPRVTRAGRWLRALSLDELPQFWNVLRGDMSLVGPRPPLPREVAVYAGWHRRRLSVRPGVTGPWQVAGRNDLPQFDRWVDIELEYIDHWSLWRDVQILLRTIPEVLSLHGR